MANVTLDQIAQAFGMSGQRTSDMHQYAVVQSENADGSYQVKMGASTSTVRAAKLCDAGVGDRVMCLIHDGQVAAIARVGGSMPDGLVIDSELSSTSQNPVQNRAIKTAIDTKQDPMDAATNADVLAMFA